MPTRTAPSWGGDRSTDSYAHATVDATYGCGGIELRVDPWHALRVELLEGKVRAVAHVGPLRQVLAEYPGGPVVTLELRVRPPSPSQPPVQGPDEVVVGVVNQQRVQELASLDGRYLSMEVATGFTGRMVGVTCTLGRLRIESFDYAGSDEGDALPAS